MTKYVIAFALSVTLTVTAGEVLAQSVVDRDPLPSDAGEQTWTVRSQTGGVCCWLLGGRGHAFDEAGGCFAVPPLSIARTSSASRNGSQQWINRASTLGVCSGNTRLCRTILDCQAPQLCVSAAVRAVVQFERHELRCFGPTPDFEVSGR